MLTTEPTHVEETDPWNSRVGPASVSCPSASRSRWVSTPTAALLSGAVGGVWFGLFVGVLFSLLTLTTFGRAMVFGMSWGLVFGVGFAAVGFALTRGRRDFTSLSATVPSRFEVLVDAAHAQRATTVLAGMSW